MTRLLAFCGVAACALACAGSHGPPSTAEVVRDALGQGIQGARVAVAFAESTGKMSREDSDRAGALLDAAERAYEGAEDVRCRVELGKAVNVVTDVLEDLKRAGVDVPDEIFAALALAAAAAR